MGGFYSFRVFAPVEVMLIENFVVLDQGPNTFNVYVDDLPSFLERLRSENVRVDAMHHLDPEPEELEDPLLTGGSSGSDY
jgi:hypothetical protein